MISVRPTTTDDAPAVGKLHVETCRQTYRGIFSDAFLRSMTFADSADRTLRRLARGAFCYVALDDQGSIIGLAEGGPVRDEHPGFPGEVYALYVHPDWQGNGIGRKLMDAVMSRLSEARLSPILVWVIESNVKARKFYERLGGRLLKHGLWRAGDDQIPEVAYAFDAAATPS